MKKILFVLGLFISLNASAQLVYPTSVFWQFLEGYQAGDSTTQKYLEYKNGFLLLETNQRDAKVLQVRNELNDIGISTLFIDANGNGGLSIDSAAGQTVIKLRGALNDHSYINNTHVSIGRGGQSQDYGGNVDGAKFTVSDEREPGYGLWDADNYQMMLQSSKDSIGGYVGLAFTSENAIQDRNVGAFINYLKTGNNGAGELHFGTKTATVSLANGIHAMKIYDGSVTIDSSIVLPNLYTNTSDTVLVISNDTVYSKVSISDNIYTADGTLTGDRTVNLNGNELKFIDDDGIKLEDNSLGIYTTLEPAGGNDDFPRAAFGIGSDEDDGIANAFLWIFPKASTGDYKSGVEVLTKEVVDANTKRIGIFSDLTEATIISSSNNGSGSGQPIRFSTTNGEDNVLYLATDNNVGIGTSSPSASLHIIGDEQCNLIVESTVTGSGIDFVDNTTSDYNQVGIGALGDNLCFRSGGVAAGNMRLTDAGDLGIGTTSPSARLHADNTDTSGVGAIFENSNVSNTGDLAQFHNSTGEVASITNEGYIKAQATTSTSDTVAVWDGDTLKKKELIVESGTYTPTITDSLNVDSTTVNVARYNRTGNFVTVYIDLDIDATNADLTIIGIGLPVASDFDASTDAVGYGSHRIDSTSGERGGMVTTDVGGDKVYFTLPTVTSTVSVQSYVNFTYEIK